MEYVYGLTGFHQEDNNIRTYVFEGIGADRTRRKVTVSVDLGLIRKYEIPLQELPLLCHDLLEGQSAGQQVHTLTFTKKDMLGYANRRAAARHAAEERKAHRRFHSSRGGHARRSPKATEPWS